MVFPEKNPELRHLPVQWPPRGIRWLDYLLTGIDVDTI